jgi:hypothetical protein
MPTEAAYVPGYAHDCFLSYAWVDNSLPGLRDPADGWVHALANNLKALLAQQLGRADWADIWLDRRLDRTQAITPEVQEAVRDAAVLLVILSQGYLESPWCTRELELFLARHQDAALRDGRIFVVHRTDIPPAERPAALRDLLGYELFSRRGDSVTTLGWPYADYQNPQDRDYFKRLDDLSRDLARRLRDLRGQAGAPRARATPPDFTGSPEPDRAPTTPAPIPSGPSAGTIFLARGTPDLRKWRDLLQRQLEQSGFGVRPAAVYPAAPEDLRTAVIEDLAGCLLFVQVLGPYSTDKSRDLPQGFECLQLELAQAAGVPILRWCDPTLDQSTMDDRDLLTRAEVVVTCFDDFKRQVEAQARRLLIPPPSLPPGETQVLIRHAAVDEDTAYRLGESLLSRGVGYELADERAALSDLVAAQPRQGLAVVYEQCDREWAKRQVQECRVIAMEGKGRAPACAVLDPPIPNKPRLGIKVPRFFFLSGLDAPEFGGFVAALNGAAVP